MSEQDAIRQQLQQLKPYLVEKFHVSSLGLFGSAVRDDFSENSDIDILVDFAEPVGVEFIDLANELEVLLQRRVDLVSRNGIKAKYFRAIESEIVYV
jgi:predicted nucleotidyltransferase